MAPPHHNCPLLEVQPHVMIDFASCPHSTNPKHFISLFSDAFPPPQHGSSKIFSVLQITMLVAYAHNVWSGRVTRSPPDQVCAQTVKHALRAITTMLQLAGQQSLMGLPQEAYPKALQQLPAGYEHSNPPPQQGLAVPLALPHYLL